MPETPETLLLRQWIGPQNGVLPTLQAHWVPMDLDSPQAEALRLAVPVKELG